MNRRHALAAVVLGSAVVFLSTACGPSDSGSSAPASGATASTAAGSTAPSSPASASGGSAGVGSSPAPAAAVPAAAPPRAKPATEAPTAASGTAGGDWKPCYLPTGYDHFFKLDSAEVYQGDTTVRVTPETCTVNKNDDEDVVYTPVGAARSFVVDSGASVKVLKDTTTPDSVTPRWLVDNKLVNSPYFSYRVNGQNHITAMQEIYHP
jgi:hypothetical protein